MYKTATQQWDLLTQLNCLYPNEEFKEVTRLPSTRNIVLSAKANMNQYIFKMAPSDHCDLLYREARGITELYDHGGPVPRPLPIIDGCGSRINYDGREYVVRGYEYIKGTALTVSDNTFYCLGVSIGKLHDTWQIQERPSWVPEINITDLIFEPIEAIAKRHPLQSKQPVIRRLSQEVADVLAAHRDPDYLGFTHGDSHHLNAIQNEHGEIVMIDLEDLGWQWRAYDLATAIWGSFGRGGSAAVWNALIAGYTSVRQLSQAESMLIRYLIFARHLWWLGQYAKNWERWRQRYTLKQFFDSGIELLEIIARDVCGIKEC